MWKSDTTIRATFGGTVICVFSTAFLCGLAGLSWAQYMGRVFGPRRSVRRDAIWKVA